MNGLTQFEAAWIGKGVGAPHSDETIRELIQQGRTLHELMLHHAAYDAFSATEYMPPTRPLCTQGGKTMPQSKPPCLPTVQCDHLCRHGWPAQVSGHTGLTDKPQTTHPLTPPTGAVMRALFVPLSTIQEVPR